MIKNQNQIILEDFLSKKQHFLYKEHFSKWNAFKINGVIVLKENGDSMSFKGVGYSGSVIKCFWLKEYIPKWIEKFCKDSVELALENSEKFSIQPNKCLENLKLLFVPWIDEVYKEMAKTDALNRSTGWSMPPPKDVSGRSHDSKKICLDIIYSHKLNKYNSCVLFIEKKIVRDWKGIAAFIVTIFVILKAISTFL